MSDVYKILHVPKNSFMGVWRLGLFFPKRSRFTGKSAFPASTEVERVGSDEEDSSKGGDDRSGRNVQGDLAGFADLGGGATLVHAGRGLRDGFRGCDGGHAEKGWGGGSPGCEAAVILAGGSFCVSL